MDDSNGDIVRAGLLRKRITIQNTTASQDTYGAQNITWENFAVNRPAEVTPLSGREFFDAQQTQSSIEVRFKIRYIRGIKPKMRILYNGEGYDIQSVINLNERNREFQILCSRVST